MGLKMNFRIKTKNHAVVSKIIDFRAVGTYESHPTAWELRNFLKYHVIIYYFKYLEKAGMRSDLGNKTEREKTGYATTVRTGISSYVLSEFILDMVSEFFTNPSKAEKRFS